MSASQQARTSAAGWLANRSLKILSLSLSGARLLCRLAHCHLILAQPGAHCRLHGTQDCQRFRISRPARSLGRPAAELRRQRARSGSGGHARTMRPRRLSGRGVAWMTTMPANNKSTPCMATPTGRHGTSGFLSPWRCCYCCCCCCRRCSSASGSWRARPNGSKIIIRLACLLHGLARLARAPAGSRNWAGARAAAAASAAAAAASPQGQPNSRTASKPAKRPRGKGGRFYIKLAPRSLGVVAKPAECKRARIISVSAPLSQSMLFARRLVWFAD